MGAEGSFGRCNPQPQPHNFNGAAPEWVRKAMRVSPCRAGGQDFNGAAPEWVRKANNSINIGNTIYGLQWGRTRMGAEGALRYLDSPGWAVNFNGAAPEWVRKGR